MGHYILISLSRDCEREVLVDCLNVLLMSSYVVVAYSPEVSKSKGVVLRIIFFSIEGGLCAFASCITLVSLRITLIRESYRSEFTSFLLGLGSSLFWNRD